MKWINHIVIGGAIAAAFNPAMIPVAVAGSTAPDWLEYLAKKTGNPVKHRTVTHYLSSWGLLVFFAAFVWDFQNILFWFSVGGLSHVIADSLTVTGIPLGWWSDRRFHLFGGRIKTGQLGEYFVSAGVCITAFLIGYSSGQYDKGFFPFFYHWQDLYNSGVIDGEEWKKNRFKWI